MFAFGLTEPNAGTDVPGLTTTAVKDGDDYIINGKKHYISNGGNADIIVVYAKTDPAAGSRGISAFIVERDTPGLRIGEGDDKLGIRAARTYELFFEDCRIPAKNRVGDEGEGFKLAMEVIDRGRLGVAAMAVGIARAALDEALKYSKERLVANKTIAEFQGIQSCSPK